MRNILSILQEAYDYPVDIEFTMNFVDEKNYRINLVQCRPLQVQGLGSVKLPEIKVPEASRIIEARGAVVGEHPHLDQAVRLQCAVHLLDYGRGEPVIADHDDRLQVMGIGTVRLAFGGGQRECGHFRIIDAT
jgi:hypothetical protein